MKTKQIKQGHTPGPWRIGNTFFHNDRIIDQNGQAVILEDYKALIAAAPELLEALKSVLESEYTGTKGYVGPGVAIAKLIAKAEWR